MGTISELMALAIVTGMSQLTLVLVSRKWNYFVEASKVECIPDSVYLFIVLMDEVEKS